MEKKCRLIRNIILPVVFGCLYFVVSYKIVYKHMMIEGTDYSIHGMNSIVIFQEGLVNLFKNYPYPIWHLTVKFFERIFRFSLFDSAATASAIFYGLTYVVVFYFSHKYLKKQYTLSFFALISVLMLLVEPITIEGLKWKMVTDVTLINPWHNPTNVVARLFGIICFFLVADSVSNEKENTKKRELVLLIGIAISSMLATFGKPSFIQTFLPTIGLYGIFHCLHAKMSNFCFWLRIAIAFIPSIFVVVFQYIMTFTQEAGNGGIEFVWFEVIRASGSNAILYLLTGLSFPIYFLVAYFKKNYKDCRMQLAWFFLIISFLEYAVLAEVGERRYHGNFGWGYAIALFIVTMLSIIKFFEVKKEENRVKSVIGIVILILHVWCGCSYLWWQLNVPWFWY